MGRIHLTGRFSKTLDLVAFHHTIFALPFALMALFWGSGGWPRIPVLFWILGAMVGARTAAMAFNRLVDHTLDSSNPRTSKRPLPAGTLSRGWVGGVIGASLLLLLLCAWALNPLCLALAPFLILFLLGYSYSKRFTWLCHFWLGLCLGSAPIAVWLALDKTLTLPIFLLGGGVSLWVAGFDILYSLQDMDHDRQSHLFSIPNRFGAEGALWISRCCHLSAVVLWFATGIGFSAWWSLGLAIMTLILFSEHILIARRGSRAIPMTFFTFNGWGGILFFLVSLPGWWT